MIWTCGRLRCYPAAHWWNSSGTPWASDLWRGHQEFPLSVTGNVNAVDDRYARHHISANVYVLAKLTGCSVTHACKLTHAHAHTHNTLISHRCYTHTHSHTHDPYTHTHSHTHTPHTHMWLPSPLYPHHTSHTHTCTHTPHTHTHTHTHTHG